MVRPGFLFFALTLFASACGGGSVQPADGGGGDSASGCSSSECGPVPQFAPSLTCSDGTTAGPVCSRYPSGTCAWSLTACPNSTSCPGESCGPSAPGGFCNGLGNRGLCVTDGKNGCTWEVMCSDLPQG
ncbi:MAG TPA: hypothetical protein VKQ32_16185 [Polyangia bacterium]|nr:hypothetical protein [Polyangia bacterium]